MPGQFSRHIPAYYAYPDDKYYYAFTRGPVRFVVLDSGEDKTDDSVEYGGLVGLRPLSGKAGQVAGKGNRQ